MEFNEKKIILFSLLMYTLNYASISLTNRHFIWIYYGSTVVSLRVDSVDSLHFQCDFRGVNIMFEAKERSVMKMSNVHYC